MAEAPLESTPATLELINIKLDKLITVVETEKVLVSRFDDRLFRAEKLERSLATTMLALAATRSWVPGAVAGAVAGGVVAWVLTIAGAGVNRTPSQAQSHLDALSSDDTAVVTVSASDRR
jgi:hypothetical protein